MKVAFYTLGCKVNQYETDIMIKEFMDKGYEVVKFTEKANIYVINSCSVTNMSTRKTRQYLSRAKNMGGIVVLVGCYAEAVKEESDIKNVDLVLGNEEKKEIVKYVEKYLEENNIKFSDSKIENNKVKYVIGDISKVKKYIQKEKLEKGINIRESIKIEDGCNNFCSYCIIPYLRGRVRSRSLEDIKDEVTSLVKNGVREVVLVGIEIASYGKELDENIGLVDVVETISKIDGLNRVRLGSLEPRILTDENIIKLSKIDKLCPHFHISVQSIDNGVLSRMNRRYTREFLFDRVSMLKKYFLHPAITCDIIVGFPGETDEEFSNTIDGVKKIEFYELHVFKYSKRKWTRAAKMENQVDGNISAKRSEELISIGNELKDKYMNEYLGKTLDVLFESYDNGYLYGYTPNYIKVKVKGDESLWGKQVPVTLYSKEEELMLGSI
jgi:threonylcarbamoyladenosine tRNA methylthiotransferase MtaB